MGHPKAKMKASPLNYQKQILSCHHWLFRGTINENLGSHMWKTNKARGEIDVVKNEKPVVEG